MSDALASSSACVIRRAPLSSAIAASVTGAVVGASFTGVISSVAVVATGAATQFGAVAERLGARAVAVEVDQAVAPLGLSVATLKAEGRYLEDVY